MKRVLRAVTEMMIPKEDGPLFSASADFDVDIAHVERQQVRIDGIEARESLGSTDEKRGIWTRSTIESAHP